MRGFSCQSTEDRLDEYLQGTLDRQSKIQLEMHLGICENCKQTLEIWQGFLHASRTEEPDPLSPMVRRRLAIAAVAERPASRWSNTINWKRWAIASAGFAALALVALVLVIQSFDFQRPPPKTGVPSTPHDRPLLSDPASSPSQVVITLDGRRVIRVTPGTNLWLSERARTEMIVMNDQLAKFRLISGRVVAEVNAPAKGYRFIIATPNGEVEAKGTIFGVEVTPDGRESAQVLRGVVEVRSRARFAGPPLEPLRLYEGERAEVTSLRRAQAPQDSLKRDACLVQGCEDPRAVDLTRLPHEMEVRPATQDHSKSHEASTAGLNKDNGQTRKAVATTKHRSPERHNGARRSREHLLEEQQQEVADPVDSLISLALRQRKNREYKKAANTYREIIQNYPTSTAACNALVSLGQLELLELGHASKALQHYDSYINRAPEGFLVEEARLGRVRAYHQLGRYKKVIRAATIYLTSHPDGYAGAEVLRLRGDAKRALGDCQGATEDYREILANWPRSRQNAQAEEGVTSCSSQ